MTEFKDENQCSGGNTGNRLNRAHKPDQVRSPLSPIPPPVNNAPNGDDPTGPEHTENRTKSPDSPPPSDEPLTGYLGEQEALSVAERLLSRSMTMACAEDGVTLNAELGTNYPLTFEPKF